MGGKQETLPETTIALQQKGYTDISVKNGQVTYRVPTTSEPNAPTTETTEYAKQHYGSVYDVTDISKYVSTGKLDTQKPQATIIGEISSTPGFGFVKAEYEDIQSSPVEEGSSFTREYKTQQLIDYALSVMPVEKAAGIEEKYYGMQREFTVAEKPHTGDFLRNINDVIKSVPIIGIDFYPAEKVSVEGFKDPMEPGTYHLIRTSEGKWEYSSQTQPEYENVVGLESKLAYYEKTDINMYRTLQAFHYLSAEDPFGAVTAYRRLTGKEVNEKAMIAQTIGKYDKEGPLSYVIESVPFAIGTAMVGGYVFSMSEMLYGKYVFTAAGAAQKIKGVKTAVGVGFISYQTLGGISSYTKGGAEGLIRWSAINVPATYIGFETYRANAPRFYRSGALKGYNKFVETSAPKDMVSTYQRFAEVGISLEESPLGSMRTKALRSIDYESIETLQTAEGRTLDPYVRRVPLRYDAEIFGSASERAQMTEDWLGSSHDIDIAVKQYGRATVTTEKAGQLFGIEDYKTIMDIKVKPRVGSQVGILGAIEQESIPAFEGEGALKPLSESAARHFESSLLLAHEGRVKDIPRSTLLWKDLYIQKYGNEMLASWSEGYDVFNEKIGIDVGLSKRAGKTYDLVKEYSSLAGKIEKKPLIMTEEMSERIYGPSGKMSAWQEFKVSALRKILPESTKMRMVEDVLDVRGGKALPSERMGLKLEKSPEISDIIKFNDRLVSPYSSSLRFKPSISPSRSKSSSLSRLLSPSLSPSKSISKSLSISESPSISESISSSYSLESPSPSSILSSSDWYGGLLGSPSDGGGGGYDFPLYRPRGTRERKHPVKLLDIEIDAGGLI